MSSQPPKHFQVEIESKVSSNRYQRCNLCKVERNSFVCKNCLKNGNWRFSAIGVQPERFVDKQQKLKNLLNAQRILEKKFNSNFAKLLERDVALTSINSSKKRQSVLKLLIKEKRENIQKLNMTKKETLEKNRDMTRILPKYSDKVNRLEDFVLEAVEKNDDLKRKSQEQMDQLRLLRRNNIDKLVKFIFPMSQQIAKSSSIKSHSRKASNESLKPETINEIAEAMLMTTGAKSDLLPHGYLGEFIIVAPSLNSNGNYQEYCDWIHSNKDGTVNSGMAATAGTSDPGQVANNHAYRIAAALTYIAQLVQALSFYLDVKLPHKVSYNDFCTMELNEQQFRKKVARLNLNIVYLCYTQNLTMKHIQPARTMENIFHLLDIRNCELGKTGPVLDASQRSVDSIMQSFTEIFDEEQDTDDDDSEDASLQKDWETVGNLPLIEISHSMVPQQSVSMAGMLQNVAQSFWKWK